VLAALLCEKVLREADGVVSAIRIADKIIQTAAAPGAPDEMAPFVMTNLTLLIVVKADRAQGRHVVSIVPTLPDGTTLPAAETPIELQRGSGGVNVVVPLALPISATGVYWFDVALRGPRTRGAGRLTARVPLEVVFQRTPVATIVSS